MSAALHKVRPYLDRFLQSLLVLLVLGLVFSVSWQVASRYLLQSPSSWTEELARLSPHLDRPGRRCVCLSNRRSHEP